MAFPLYKREMRDERKDYKTGGLRDGRMPHYNSYVWLKTTADHFYGE